MPSFDSNSTAGRINEQVVKNLLDLKRREAVDLKATLDETQAAFKAYQDASAKKLDLLIKFIHERLGCLPDEVLEIIADRTEQRIEASLVPPGALASAPDGQVLARSGDIVDFVSPPLAVKPP